MFKKSPISNVQTHQDNLIKNQELDKHVVFLTYHVDEYWSELKKVEFCYLTSPKCVTYTYDITGFAHIQTTRTINPDIEQALLSVKQGIKKKRNQK